MVLADGGEIPHPYIGISMMSLTPEKALKINADPNAIVELPEMFGGLILAVNSGTPAALAGLRAYDLIVEMGGHSVQTFKDAEAIVDNSRIGERINCKIVRKGVTLEI